jgi:hypothetical protein
MSDWIGRVGRARSGQDPGRYVEVTLDESRSGWHIWVTVGDPRQGPSDGWDIWADDVSSVESWLGPESLDVEWLD